MMAVTHGFLSLAAAVALLPVLPAASAPVVLAAALVGGVAPDADLLWTHRRTLHFPVYGPVAAALLWGAVLLTGSGVVLLAAVATGAAALHAVTDLLGGSAEHEPWNPVTDYGVYNHAAGRWERPLRYVRYSGAPEDLMLAAALAGAVALAPATPPTLDRWLLAALLVAALYTAARRLGALAALGAALPVFRIREREGGGTTVELRRR